MKFRILLLFYFSIPSLSIGQARADLGITLDPGVSYVTKYFKEDWQPFRPSFNANIYIEKNGSVLSYGTSLNFIHLRSKEWRETYDTFSVNSAGIITITTTENITQLNNSSSIGINFYSTISVKKFRLTLGLMPFKEIFLKETMFVDELTTNFTPRTYKYKFRLISNFGLGCKFELSYPISKNIKLRFTGMQTYFDRIRYDPVQFTFGLGYRLMALGTDEY